MKFSSQAQHTTRRAKSSSALLVPSCSLVDSQGGKHRPKNNSCPRQSFGTYSCEHLCDFLLCPARTGVGRGVGGEGLMVKPPPAFPVPIVRAIPPVVIAEKVIAGLQSKPTETHVRRIEERPARYGEWPEALDERLVSVLGKRGMER